MTAHETIQGKAESEKMFSPGQIPPDSSSDEEEDLVLPSFLMDVGKNDQEQLDQNSTPNDIDDPSLSSPSRSRVSPSPTPLIALGECYHVTASPIAATIAGQSSEQKQDLEEEEEGKAQSISTFDTSSFRSVLVSPKLSSTDIQRLEEELKNLSPLKTARFRPDGGDIRRKTKKVKKLSKSLKERTEMERKVQPHTFE